MSLSVGLIGLPNAGKSTTFNVLAQQTAALTASYPFSTVEPNRLLIDVPDQRLESLGELTKQSRRIKVKLELVDIAGLVSGASRGEGLGNQFLDQTRHCDALVHVVACFGERMVSNAEAASQIVVSLNTVNQELLLSDLALLEGRISRLEQEVKNDASLKSQLSVAQKLHVDLESGVSLRCSSGYQAEPFKILERDLRFISSKPELILLNLDEEHLSDPASLIESLATTIAKEQHVTAICARIEEEMLELPAEEQIEYREAYKMHFTGLQRIVARCFELLELIRFYTLGDKEVRAWAVPANCRAVEGAGRIHTDFARGFIAAEVISFDKLVQAGSEREAKVSGQLRAEGRNYAIQDGDVIRFRFNV